MINTEYSSNADSKILTLSEASWQIFSPFVSHYQWAFDHPSHSPRKHEIASAILNRAKKGRCTFWRPDGYKYILPVLHSRHFDYAVPRRRRIYYVSYGKQALLYLDTDIHKAWQTVEDAQQAQELLSRLFSRYFGQPVLFSSASSLGGNDYLKVNLCGMDYQRANGVLARLEWALQLFLAYCGNWADFEIKGTVGFIKDGQYTWGKYGKLPIHNPSWNFAKLKEFKRLPPVSVYGLESLCDQIEAQVPQVVLERHKADKKSKGDTPFFHGDSFLVTPAIEKAIADKHGEAWRWMFDCQEDHDGRLWMHRSYYRPGQLPLTWREWREARERSRNQEKLAQQPELPVQIAVPEVIAEQPNPVPEGQRAKASKSPLKINIKLMDLASEPDSFNRQKEALFRFARYLKQVPTLDDALKYLHEQSLFTGCWEQNQARRKARVRDILKFIARTFDPGKCAHGSVNVGKYDEWAAKNFPKGLIGRTRSSLSEEGTKVDGQTVHVSPSFIGVFLAVCEFALRIDKNQDDSLPHHRGQSIWETLYAKELVPVPFCARKWAVCREELEKHGIVAITDRDYHQGKAMRWATGPYFPFLGLWKRPKPPSVGGSVLEQSRERTREHRHNTLLHQQSPRTELKAHWMPARPPP